jgi:hypothetical protein
MKKSRFTEEQITFALRQTVSGTAVQALSPGCENATLDFPPCPRGLSNEFLAAQLGCTVFYADWNSFDGLIHVYHDGVNPGGLYTVDVIDEACVVIGP